MAVQSRRRRRCGLAFVVVGIVACNDDVPPCEALGEPACLECESGSLQWRRTYLGGISTNVAGVAADECGAALVAGHMAADRMPGAERAFVGKYRPNGTLAWMRISDHWLGDQWWATASDGRGLLVAGQRVRRRKSWDEADSDGVIARMSTDGDWLWRRTFDDDVRGSADHIIWLAATDRIVASGDGEMSWLRLLDGDGHILYEELALPDAIRALAATSDGGFVAATKEHVVRYDADGIERQRHAVADTQVLAVDPDDRVLVARGTWGVEVAEIAQDGTVQAWPAARADGLHIEAVAVDEAGIVFAGFDTVDDRRMPWVRHYDPDRKVRWTWSDPAAGDRVAAAVAIADDGSIVVAGENDASVFVGGIDTDLWIGSLSR